MMKSKLVNAARRSFLKRAPIAAAAVGLAAKDAALAPMTDLRLIGEPANGISTGPMANAGNPVKLLSLLNMGGVPAWKKQELRYRARSHSRVLDPDIAVLRSVSIGMKIRLQEERIYARLESSLFENLAHEIARKAFSQTHGVDQWW